MCAAKTVETSFVQNMGAGRTEGSDKLNLSSSIPAQPIYCITHSKVNPQINPTIGKATWSMQSCTNSPFLRIYCNRSIFLAFTRENMQF